MCDFPSWIVAGGKTYFLTDKDAKKYMRLHPERRIYDMVGHSAIKWVHPEISLDSKDYDELEGFDTAGGVPKEMVRAIKNGEMKALMKADDIAELHFNSKGQLHNLRGPAYVNTEGVKSYIIKGVWGSEADYREILKSRKKSRKTTKAT